MDQIVKIRHLSGSKVGQSNEFTMKKNHEISVGRDDGLDVQYDPEKDDLVSRRHAVISSTEDDGLRIKDNGSRNGTFVNKKRISESSSLAHGDIVQLGPGGPEFQVELDPPPKTQPPPTRVVGSYSQIRQTRAAASNYVRREKRADRSDGYRQKGRFTLLQDNFNAYKAKSLRTQVSIGAGFLGILILIAGFSYALVMDSSHTPEEIYEIVDKRDGIMSPQEIGKNYTSAVVKIDLDWKLTHRESNKQVYHRRISVRYPNRIERIPAYLEYGNKVIPWLMTDDEQGTNFPIGGSGSGSGFSVSRYGLILTNKHVGAKATSNWGIHSYMEGYEKSIVFTLEPDNNYPNAYVYKVNIESKDIRAGERHLGVLRAVEGWIPANEQILINKILFKGKEKFSLSSSPNQFISRDTLNVYFPGDPNPMPGRLARKSFKHDVSLITIDSAGVLPAVTLEESKQEPPQGEPITILGYPSVSTDVMAVTDSRDPFASESTVSTYYDPTLTTGHLGKLITPEKYNKSGIKTVGFDYDHYQLTANATGTGNSGGPVFNSKGRVIGIFYAASESGGARVTFAIPIKYGQELLAGYKSALKNP